jgi:hypothetical protein
MKVRDYRESDSAAWDALVAASTMGCFQHTRRFLGYGGGRFRDRSLVFERNGELVGVLPAAEGHEGGTSVVSHPGATYGGLVHVGARDEPALTAEVLAAAREYLAIGGATRLLYKTVPFHLQPVVSQTDQHAIWQLGGRLVRRDIWNVIDLQAPHRLSTDRRHDLRKAREAGIDVAEDNSPAAHDTFAEIVATQLAERHGVRPQHTSAEMLELRERLPDDISLWVARDGTGTVVAGAWVFRVGTAALHTQYLATTEAGRETRALPIVVTTLMEHACSTGIRYLSFGASTEAEGHVVNHGLFSYKAAFGRGSVVHDFYEIDLSG